MYRRDIDGLRAVAILLVVAFHAFPNLMPGGFVGVDVFFVISGYLINGLILEKLRHGEFSFSEFYYRRIRRIFPALILTLSASALIGARFLQTEEFKKIGSHIVSGALFISNFKYWSEAGYFDAIGESKPLLHLWSLGVEEQFYIVWPFLAWAAYKVRLKLWVLALCIAGASFVWNIVEVERQQLVADFYSPATRFWEIMIGALLAGAEWDLAQKLRHWLSVIGIAAIAAAAGLLDKNSTFPGGWALLPTIGTAALIASGPAASVNRRLLSQPLLVGVGLISYPLYLWHWPLLSFAWIAEGALPSPAVRIGAILAAAVLSYLTYQFVEKPIRFGAWSQLAVGVSLAAFLLSLSALGYLMRGGTVSIIGDRRLVNDGETATEGGHAVFFNYVIANFYPCAPDVIKRSSLPPWPPRCQQSKPGEAIDVAIIGDSHAEDLFIGLAENLPKLNVVKYIQNSWPGRSTGLFDEVLDHVEMQKSIRVVILGAYWGFRRKDVPIGSDFRTELSKTVKELTKSGKIVYLADDRPVFPFDASVCKYLRPRFFWQPERREPRCSMDLARIEQQRLSYLSDLQAVVAMNPNVRLLDTSSVFCGEAACEMAKDNVLLFRDISHLTIAGSRILGKSLAPQIQ